MGLWSKRAILKINNTNSATWSFRVTETETSQGIPAIDILSLMRDFEMERIDVLKIDIEGSEVEVLRHSEPWLSHVETLVIELHDRFRPGCNDALEYALRAYDYMRHEYGENIVFSRLRKRAGINLEQGLNLQNESPAAGSDEDSMNSR